MKKILSISLLFFIPLLLLASNDTAVKKELVPSVSSFSNQNLHFRNIEYHSVRKNSSKYEDYIKIHLITSNGNDSIIVEDDIGSKRDKNHGGRRSVTTADGDDTLLVKDDVQYGAMIDMGNGDDRIKIAGNLEDEASVSMGNGNDSVDIHSIKSSSLFTGNGDDTVTIQRIDKGLTSISLGSGEDTLYIKDVSSQFDTGNISLDEGNDQLTIDDTLSGTESIFDAGIGEDRLILTNVSKEEWKNGIKDIFVNFEKVIFEDGRSVDLTPITPAIIIISDELTTTLAQHRVAYNRITLEIPTTSTKTLRAINQTLSQEQNRTIRVKGVDNEGTFYLYNIPLIKGENHIELNATNEAGVELIQTIIVNADANQSLPLAMTAIEHEDIGSLDTQVIVLTGLNATEYLFDNNGDGIIDVTQSDGNFTVSYTEEGRYKPRVTLRTQEGLLFSSDFFELSLDVKATAEQYDPIGATPQDTAKEYVQAFIDGDRRRVEQLLGENQRRIHAIYDNPEVTKKLQEIYSNVISWEQTYTLHRNASTIRIFYKLGEQIYEGGFEMNVVHSHGTHGGRKWFIRLFY